MGLRPEAYPVDGRTTLWARGPWPGWAGFGHSSGWRSGVGPQMASWVPWAPRLSRGSFTASVVMTWAGLLSEAGLQERLLESGDGGSREPSSSAGQ